MGGLEGAILLPPRLHHTGLNHAAIHHLLLLLLPWHNSTIGHAHTHAHLWIIAHRAHISTHDIAVNNRSSSEWVVWIHGIWLRRIHKVSAAHGIRIPRELLHQRSRVGISSARSGAGTRLWLLRSLLLSRLLLLNLSLLLGGSRHVQEVILERG